MTVKTKRISTLIESQLPEFIAEDYELFSKFVEKYYEAQENQGGPLDIINNIQKYLDIDYYEKSILKQNTIILSNITADSTTIVLEDGSGFPSKNGYIRIENEIIFYEDNVNNTLTNCFRGVSGNVSLGDLYEKSNFITTSASPHASGNVAYNVSNLFLYAIIRNFETQYLGSFPEKYLKGQIDKRNLIKNIQKFYKAKGTDSSIKFLFNAIIPDETKPDTYAPKDFTYKSSTSDWTSVYALKVKIISGNPQDLIGKRIIQSETDEYGYAFATVDNVFPVGNYDNEQVWNIVLAPETVSGLFAISTKTRLEKTLPSNFGVGKYIDVFSTIGWESTGEVLIDDEIISFSDTNVTQFTIEKRGTLAVSHSIGASVYKPVILQGSNVKLLTLGVVYNFSPINASPYSVVGDEIQISEPGFQSIDPKIVNAGTNQPRWVFGTGAPILVPSLPLVETSLIGIPTNVSAILEDDQYYYINSSSYPSHRILDGSTTDDKTLLNQKILRLIRKEAIKTTEVYSTPNRDVGILLNGVPIYGYKDQESVRFGLLEKISINTQGTGYAAPPFVLLDGFPNQARSVLSGQIVESIIVDTKNTFPRTPEVVITSGRAAEIRAVVTKEKITSLIIENPGEFYSSPPIVSIRDTAGRGRAANYTALVNTDGQITGFVMNDEGNFYNQNTVVVDIIPVGKGATGIPLLKEWTFNRFTKLSSKLDTEFGYIFKNYNNVLEYGYGNVANPKALRVLLNDNINNAGSEPATKTHSPIIGFAYDGNPIYGPFGHQDPLNPQSPISRMTSSYALINTRASGPSLTAYPPGTFTNDYIYSHKSGSLDENNGRFCVTPDFPEGTYAYFITIDGNQAPQFPYIIGKNFYSLPVDSNYNSDINQSNIPKNAKRFYSPGMPRNGEGVIAKVAEVKSGVIDSILLSNSSYNFSVNSDVYFNNSGTDGKEVSSIVSSVNGKTVNYLQSKENKAVQLTLIQTAYLFANDTLSQPATGAYGEIIGNVFSDNVVVLKNVQGTFNSTGSFSASIKTFSLLVDQNSSYTAGAILSLTDGINAPVATAEILETTSKQNALKIKVLTGTWAINTNYFLQSSNLFNTAGSKIIRLTSLSDGLNPFIVNQSVALVETTSPHGLGVGDEVNIDILPNDTTKTKTYYLRKRLYQKIKFVAPSYTSIISDTGIGRFQILNGGDFYTPGTYNNIPLTGGSGSGAKVSIVVSSSGKVSSVVLQFKGSGYKKSDYVSVSDESLIRSASANAGISRLSIYVDHVGFASGSTVLKTNSSVGVSVNDFIKIGDEVVKVSSISNNDLTVLRAQKGTLNIDHYDGKEISLYEPKYNFSSNYKISTSTYSGYIKTYDYNTQEAIVVFDYGTLENNAQTLQISTTFFDTSTPTKLVSISTTDPIGYKFEFSEDGTNFTPNPILNVQEYYKYKFDTSHSSLTGTYFDLSPSRSYNLITEEKTATTILPGSAGAFTTVKFGFGAALATNTAFAPIGTELIIDSDFIVDEDYIVGELYSPTKIGTDFTNFYYFDRNNIVSSDNSYLQIIQDPLQGQKILTYVTPTRFVYQLNSTPLWDGSGVIKYTTTGQFAIGSIDKFKMINLGLNYKKIPTIVGCDPTSSYRAKATVLFDTLTSRVIGVTIDNKGSNYVDPKIVIIEGDGVGLDFDTVVRSGEIFSITVKNAGKGYTKAPEIKIIEGSLGAYAQSNSIGVPQSINIINNGGGFHLDKTVSSKFTSKYIFGLIDFYGDFQKGEIVIQKINEVEVARGIVSEWRTGSNLLKVEKIQGTFRSGKNITSFIRPTTTGRIQSVFVTEFLPDITSFYNNIGYYVSDRGRIGVSNQKITDSHFYQDYSYVIKSRTPINVWRDLIKSTTHPAGFKLFGQVDIETDASITIPQRQNRNGHASIIQLWNPEKNKVTIENTRRVITVSIQKVENQRIRRGGGSVAPSEFNFTQYRAMELNLSSNLNGYYDTSGRLQGQTQFNLIDQQGNTLSPKNTKNLIVTLDGILQEPDVAYELWGSPGFPFGIKFSKPPLAGVKFYAKYFEFKDDQYNTRYFKKIRNIFQRNGRWIDAANQIERNRSFIIEEAIGYGKVTHPTLDWRSKLDDYQKDIGYILDAYEHDLRFGGNVKTFDYVSTFRNDIAFEYITKNKVKSLDIFKYVTKLTSLAIRNWDVVETGVSYTQGSASITVLNTDKLVIGMYISCGRAYAANTRIVSINSLTSMTLSSPALTSSGSDQATFSLSALNNGTFYDAGTLILRNKAYLQQEVSEYIYANYALPSGDKTKCARDLGILIDAIVYQLRFGGNEKVVEFGKLYYEFSGYPYGERLYTINRTPTETLAAIDAWETLGFYMNLAIKNQLSAGAYTTIPPYTDNSILVDSISPVCQEVTSSINTMISIVKDILDRGPGVVERIPANQNKSGFWTDTKTYSNYNIIADPNLISQECDDVVSSLNSLYSNTKDILDKNAVSKTLPDYVDGVNKSFELYWNDGTEVIADEDENLFLTINAVLQRPKYTSDYPRFDSYYIDRTVIPNLLVFDTAPIWDQDFGAKSIGEPTAVERVVGIGVGNYKRLTIDYNLVNNIKSGPFLILDVEDYTVQSIEQSAFLYVFLDGVLQREGYSYTISGPNITFNIPILKEMKIDMRYLYGRDIGQSLNLFDFNQDTFYAKARVTLQVTSGLSDLLGYTWMGDKIGYPIHAYQVQANTFLNIIGEVTDLYNPPNTNILEFNLSGHQAQINTALPIYFAVESFYDKNTTVTISSSNIVYERDENSRLLLSDNNQNWAGTILGKTYKLPFVSLSNNDLLKVDGEDAFRRIKKLPTRTTSKEHRNNTQVSNSYFGSVDVGTYNGISRGEGLSVIARIQNGKIIELTWNQRSYNPLTQPTAYQYYTPPILHFIPVNGAGGGARANVLVSKGQVISVDLLDGGSNYTEAPLVVVARGYDVFSERDIGVSLINLAVVSKILAGSQFVIAEADITVIGTQVPVINSFASILYNSLTSTDRVITSELHLLRNAGDNLSKEHLQIITTAPPNLTDIEVIDVFHNHTQVISQISGRVADIISTSSLITNRQITTSFENLIPNDALSNINYYANAAFLQVDLSATDKVVYVADTSKFKSYGYLLIGDEIVQYYRKLSDRFIRLERGQLNTTAQSWLAGTYIRQIPDPISTVFAGIAVIESESQTVTMSVGVDSGRPSISTAQLQTVTPPVTLVSSQNVIAVGINPQIIASLARITILVSAPPQENPVPEIVEAFVTTLSSSILEATVQSVNTLPLLTSSRVIIGELRPDVNVQSVVQIIADVRSIKLAIDEPITVVSLPLSAGPTVAIATVQSVNTLELLASSTLIIGELRPDVNVQSITQIISDVRLINPAIQSVTVVSTPLTSGPTVAIATVQSVNTLELLASSTLIIGELRPDVNVQSITRIIADVRSIKPAIQSVTVVSTPLTSGPTILVSAVQSITDLSIVQISKEVVNIILADFIEFQSVVNITTITAPPPGSAPNIIATFELSSVPTVTITTSVTIESIQSSLITFAQIALQTTVQSVNTLPLLTSSRVIIGELRPDVNVQSVTRIITDVRSLKLAIETVTVIFNNNLRKNQLEVLRIPPPSGIIDGYEESIIVSNPVQTRLNGPVTLILTNGENVVTLRGGTSTITIRNLSSDASSYQGSYTRTNAGHRISHYNGIFDDGVCAVSALSIEEFDRLYPSMTITDFDLRSNSSYTISGDYFNLLPPSIQNPVTLSTANSTIGSTIAVQKTTYFPSSGYLFTGNRTVIQYTGKTINTFTGCTVISGSTSLSVGTNLVPFQIV